MAKSNKKKKSSTPERILHEGASGSFSYELTYKRIKNINLRMKCGEVYVSAPCGVSRERIREFVSQHEQRVLDTVAKQRATLEREEALRRLKETAYSDGGCFYYLGEPHRVSVSAGRSGVVREGGRLLVTLPKPDDPAAVRRTITAWISRETLAIVTRLTEECVPLFRPHVIRPTEILVRSLKSCIAKCYPGFGRMTFRRTLACLPIECVRFVVLHELCHFVHLDHSKHFYAELERHLPDHLGLKSYTYEQGEICFPL